MQMKSLPHIGGRTRERAVIAIGVLSALLLASAAFAPFSDPDVAGRAALSQLAGRVADGIVAEWSRMAADPLRYAKTPGPMFAWGLGEAYRDEPLPRDVHPHDDLSAFSTLLAEAERLEIAEHDARGALEIVLEALEKNLDLGQRAEARLRAIQLAVKAKRADVVRDELAKTANELDPVAARIDTSYLLLSVLAASPMLDDATRAASCARLLDLWSQGRIAVPRRLVWLEDAPAPWRMHVDPRYEALRSSLASACGDEESASALASEFEIRKLCALQDHLMPFPPQPSDGAWHVMPLQDTVFALHATAGGTEGCYFRVEDLGRALVDAARSDGLLPSGFQLDFRGNDASLGALVRGRTELVGGEFAFTLRHSDPESIVRASARRLWWIRGALVLLAAFSLGASLATARALSRERHLASALGLPILPRQDGDPDDFRDHEVRLKDQAEMAA